MIHSTMNSLTSKKQADFASPLNLLSPTSHKQKPPFSKPNHAETGMKCSAYVKCAVEFAL